VNKGASVIQLEQGRSEEADRLPTTTRFETAEDLRLKEGSISPSSTPEVFIPPPDHLLD